MSTTSWFEELESLEKVVEVFELLGGKNEPRIAALVTPYRRFVQAKDLDLREAPFSQTTKLPTRLFVFKDLLILARTQSQISRKTTFGDTSTSRGRNVAAASISSASSSNNDLSKRRSFRLSFSSKKKIPQQQPTLVQQPLTSGNLDDDVTDTQSKAKLAQWLPLLECAFKIIPRTTTTPEDTSAGFQITHVTREQRPAIDPTTSKEIMKSVTRVVKFELWFPNEKERDDIFQVIMTLFVDCQDRLAKDNAAMAASNGTTTTTTTDNDEKPKIRNWAKNKPKSIRLPKPSQGGNGDGESSSEQQMLSLQDLEKRYNVDFAPPATLDKISLFSVEFGEGLMGLSLSSGPGVGVIVAKLATDGFAEISGVIIGDRVSAVNGVDVDLETSWKRCVEMIQAAGRPVTVAFTRNSVTSETIERLQDERPSSSVTDDATPTPSPTNPATPTTTPTTENDKATATTSSAIPSKRRWARNRDVRDNGGLISLHEVEKMYLATGGGDLLVDTPDTAPAESMDESDIIPPSEVARTVSSPSVIDGKRDGRGILCDYIEQSSHEGERQCLGLLLEILETERNYVADLRALVKDYIVPLRRATKRCRCKEKEDGSLLCEHGSIRTSCNKPSSESGPLLSPDDVRVIFMNTETLVQINYELLVGLMDGIDGVANANPSPDQILFKCVGVFVSAFTRIQPLLSMYSLYCHQYAAATQWLQLVRNRESEVDEFLRKREARSTQTSLRSLLIKPVQRICRYPLLFQELLKKMNKLSNPDGGGGSERNNTLNKCVKEIETTTMALTRAGAEINKKVEDHDANQKMMMVFNELGGTEGGDKVATMLLTASRRLVRWEEVFFRTAPFDTEAVPCKMYLFNDLLIVAIEKDTDAVGGGPLGSRGGTMKKIRSRGKSLGQLIGLSKSRSNSGTGEDGGDEANSALWTMRMTTWIDLSTCQVRPLEKPDEAGWWGFQIKSVERSIATDDTANTTSSNRLSIRKSTNKMQPLSTDAGGVTGRIVTSVLKFQVWKASKDEVDKLMTDIEEQIGFLEIRQQNAEIGAQLFGAGAGQGPKRTRSWAAKKRTATSGTGGGSVSSQPGTVDATKEALEARYLGAR